MVVRRFLILIVIFLAISEISQASLGPVETRNTERTSTSGELSSNFGGYLRLANMFGSLQRFLPTGTSPEAKARTIIGMLALPSGLKCTASLVGDDLILTAAHCVSNQGQSGPTSSQITFYLNYNNGDSTASANAEPVDWGSFRREEFHRDWALLRIDRQLGRDYGYFGVKVPGSVSGSLHLAGYGDSFGYGQQISMANGCDFQSYGNGTSRLTHDCDSSNRDSGGPMFICEGGGCSIVAMHVGEERNGAGNTVHRNSYSHDYRNVAVSASEFLDAVKRQR